MLKKINDGVWQADPAFPCFHLADREFVIAQAPLTEKKRARICAHQTADVLHQMLICMMRESVCGMHRHAGPESLHIVSGLINVITDEETIHMSEQGQFFLRIPAYAWHDVQIVTPYAVFIETALGPHQQPEYR